MTPTTRILIVEDEEILAANLREYFLKRAAEVRVVGSGEAALDCAPDFEPDLMVIDFGLPGRDGLDTFVELQQVCPRVRCVLMTGHPTHAVFRAAHDCGIGWVLEKPFPFSALEEIVPAATLVSAVKQTDGYRISSKRRRGERRHAGVAASMPLHTADGWVTTERRGLDRRGIGERRATAASPAG